jgi:hypothetical protein
MCLFSNNLGHLDSGLWVVTHFLPSSNIVQYHQNPLLYLPISSYIIQDRYEIIQSDPIQTIQHHPRSSKIIKKTNSPGFKFIKGRKLLGKLRENWPWGVRLGHGFLPMNTSIGELQDCLKILREISSAGKSHRKWRFLAGKIMGEASILMVSLIETWVPMIKTWGKHLFPMVFII